jgi:hypothetical protein
MEVGEQNILNEEPIDEQEGKFWWTKYSEKPSLRGTWI